MLAEHPSGTNLAVATGAFGLLMLFVMMPGPGQAAELAAASDVRLANVDCTGNPEVVEVKNFGDEGQDLIGWQIQSDGNAPFDLTPSGTIAASASIFIESGAAAQATFSWSQSEIFRDNDPSDYARLMDNTPAPRGQIACAQAAATATASPTPTGAGTASPTPAAGGVPNGGGPPGPPAGTLSPAKMIYAGGSIVGAVIGFTVTWLGISFGLDHRRRRRNAAPAAGPNLKAQAAPQPAMGAAATGDATRAWRQPDPAAHSLLLAIVVALAAAILVALLLQSQHSTTRSR